MQKHHIGIGLIALAILLAKFLPLSGLSTGNIAILMGFGAIAWVGVIFLMGKFLPNPPGPNFKMWKMLITGTLGFVALTAVLVAGIVDTDNRVKKELKEYGVIAEAVVVGKDETTLPAKWGKKNHIYNLLVQFKDQKGVTQQVECEVQAYEYSHAYTGSPVGIEYSSRDYNINRLIFR